MEKNVKGATKVKLAAPKSKYVEPILSATHGGETGVAEIFRTLQLRLRDTTWTITFKALIVVHLMIREGRPEVALKYIAESPKRIAISQFTEGQTHGASIRRYYDYLLERVKAYRDCHVDHVRAGSGKMKQLTVDKGLLRQTESVQSQIKMLLKCEMLGGSEPDNEISITAFRLLTMDLLELYRVMNEGTINVLEHYFEMSKPDAARALAIYKTFGRQTEQVVQYLSTARQYELYTKLEVPKLKHAPTTLTSSLQEYLNDPDFDINRRQYLAQQEAKRTGKPLPKSQPASTPLDKTPTSPSGPRNTITSSAAPAKGPAPDLIDFFESIDQNQQPMAQNNVQQLQYDPNFVRQQQQQQMQAQFAQLQVAQQTGYNPFLQQSLPQPQQLAAQAQALAQPPPQPQLSALQPDFTGAGFGGYGPQPTQQTFTTGFAPTLASIPQEGVAHFSSPPQQPAAFQQPQPLQPQQTSTNPFRQSMMSPIQSPASAASSLSRQSTNPFAQSPASLSGLNQSTVPSPNTYTPPIQSPASVASGLQPQRTGTNPFAKPTSPPPGTNTSPFTTSPIPVNVTGTTNPFRQSQFVSQATGQGWQHSTQGTFAGYNMNHVDTVPVFPRPGQN